MIGYLEGTIVLIQGDRCWVSVSGIGHIVCIGGRLASTVHTGKPITLWIESIVHDGQEHLFGFICREEQTWFQWLVAVAGVGGRLAMNILSLYQPHDLSPLLRQGNVVALRQVEGVGPKLANRLVTELKDKALSWIGSIMPDGGPEKGVLAVPHQEIGMQQDALLALMALGYRRIDAEHAVARAYSTRAFESLEHLITHCLPLLSST
jgi:Holliday junction DNA helicase RuvA